MEYINYIVILIIVLVLYILCKTLHKSFNQLVRKGEDFLNLEDELGIYHNNVESHMRSEGYEQDSAPTTTHHLKEMQGLINNNHIKFPALYIGDSKFDYEVAIKAKLDFLFVSGWTEFKDWQNYCNKNKILSIKLLCDLL